MLNCPDLRHTNVYAEVRGKYARQAFSPTKIAELSKNSFHENPLLARPTTSGSLMPRNMIGLNSAHKRSQSNGEDLYIVEEVSNQKSAIRHRSISSKAGNKIVLGDSKNEDKSKLGFKKENGAGETKKRIANELNLIKEENNFSAKEEKNDIESSVKTTDTPQDDLKVDSEEDKDEAADQVSQLPDLDIKSHDHTSQYSSASQKRISELESLLKEERIKREQLENSMKKFISEKSK